MDLNNLLNQLKSLFSSGALDFLEEIDEDTIVPISLILNVDSKSLLSFCKMLPPLFKGELNLKDAQPHVFTIILTYFLSRKLSKKVSENVEGNCEKTVEKPTYSPTFDQNETANELSSFADDDIFYQIDSYLQSETAS